MQDQNQEIYVISIIGIILGLVLVGFIVTILFLYQKRQQRQEQELARVKDMYERELLRSQLEIQENTFKVISQELHDNIGQMLTVARLSLSALPVEKEHPAYTPLKNSQQVLNKAIVDLSNLIKGLFSDRIAQVGLLEAIRYEIDTVKKAGLVSLDFRVEGDAVDFGEQVSIFLFRIFQEAMNNTLKHANASQIDVVIDFRDDACSLSIRDNGTGFSPAEKLNSPTSASGVGLKSIINRANLIGASVSIDSESGKGTLILITLPINQAG